MATRKKPWKFWRKTSSLGSQTNDGDSILKVPSSSGQSGSNTSSPPVPSPSSNPPLPISPPSEKRIQISEQVSTSQTPPPAQDSQSQPFPGEGPGFFAGSHNFVLNHAILGENQNVRLNYPFDEGLQTPVQEFSPGSPSQSTSSQGLAAHTRSGLSRPPGKSTFLAQHQNVHIHNNHRKSNVLREFSDYIIPGAQFNSAERDPPPRCHPGTRISIRDDLRARVEDAGGGARIIWIHGPAGVGKSAIMQTLVEEVFPRAFCGTLFFSRPNNRDDPRKALATIAYGLAVANPDYCQYIGARMEDDPMCLTTSLDEQFRILFITPFIENRVRVGSQRWAVFLDGLDECQNTEASDNQCRIINLICDSIFDHGESVPFRWVIASRPEENLKEAWSQIQKHFQRRASDLWGLTIPADSPQATQDVELYLHKQFETIREKYSKLMPRASRWPSDGDFVKVAQVSSGLFIFASTIVRYISHEDPVYRLRFIISLIDRAQQGLTTTEEKPFQMIDQLYSSIMSEIPKRLLSVARSLLGFYFLLDRVSDRQEIELPKVGLIEACNTLGLQQNEAYAALRKLHSVLNCPTPEAAQENGIEFFHASFSDFLCDHSRSQEYYINLDQELTSVWRCYVQILKWSRAALGPAGVNISWPPGNDVLLSELQEKLLWRAQYSWIRILINNSFRKTATRRLEINIPELTETLQSLGLSFLVGDKFPVGAFLNWLDKCAPDVIRERVVSQRFPLSQLDIERLFRSLCAAPGYRYATTSDVYEISLMSIKDLDGSQWSKAKAILWTPVGEFHRLVKSLGAESVLVAVVEVEPAESCAIIGPIKLDTSDERFFILPYSAA